MTITAIPGVIVAGAKWKLVWQGPDNADGLIGTRDGGRLFGRRAVGCHGIGPGAIRCEQILALMND